MIAPVKRIIWSPQPGPQHALVQCPCEEVFMGGARGGGKTDGVLGKWAIKDGQYGPAFNAIGVRPTAVSWDDAVDRSKAIFGPLGGKFNEVKLTWRMPRGGKVRFSYLESVSDADKEQGKNLTDVWVEEAGLYPTSVAAEFLPKPIARLKAAMRSAKGVPIQMVLTGNPGGPGQQWCSRRYGLIPFPRHVRLVKVRSEAGKESVAAVIPSRLENNLILMQQDPGYEDRLAEAGSGALVKAWRYGDWSAVEGAFFDCWDERKHVVDPFEIPPHWLRFLSMDWGFAAPHSIGWWAVVSDDDAERRLHRGALIRYREWYGTGGARLPAESLARGILDREAASGESRDLANVPTHTFDRPVISYGVLDPSAFDVSRGPSIAEQMARAGVSFNRADNRRVRMSGSISGWDQMRGRLLGDADGNPMIVAFSTCADSIRTIPVLQHDPDKPEDLDTTAEDHAADDWRYGCMSRPWTRQLPTPKRSPMLGVGPHNEVTLDDLWETDRRQAEERI